MTNKWLVGIALSAILGGTGFGQDALATSEVAAVEETAVDLKSKTHRRWRIVLPEEQWMLVGTGWDFSGTLGKRFPAKTVGTSLEMDLDGDGEMDVTLDGDAKGSVVTLRGEVAGKRRSYSMFVEPNAQGWVYRAAHVKRGKIGDTAIAVIDQNNNGRYDEIGKDAIIVGKSRYAAPLSEVVNVDGKLLSLKVAANGTSLSTKAYAGEVGTFNLADGLTADAKLMSAVVQSTDRKHSFQLAKAAEGMIVPAGRYRLLQGRLALGSQQVDFRTGNSTPMKIEAGETNAVSWGGPVKAKFEYQRQGDQLQLSPRAIWYFGEKGEEYFGWTPDGKSPKFTINNAKDGAEIAVAYFPGSG